MIPSNQNNNLVQVNPQMALAVREALDTCAQGSGLLTGWFRNKSMKQRVETMQYLNSFLALSNQAGMEVAAQQYGLTGAMYGQVVVGRMQMEMRMLEKEMSTEIETKAKKDIIWAEAEAKVYVESQLEQNKNKAEKERATDEADVALKLGPLNKLQRATVIEEELHRKYEAADVLKREKSPGWKRKLADIEKSIQSLEKDLENIRNS